MLIGDDVNAMQRLLTRLIAKKINAATSHIRRIIMSEDTSENPAEIYGTGGKIYYRSAGGIGVELNSTATLWLTENVGAYPAITPNPSSNISLKKSKSIMNPNAVYIRLENPESAAGEEDVNLAYWWEDIGGSAGVNTSHYQEEAPP